MNLVGDTFVATTYRKYFLNRVDNVDKYIKSEFEFAVSCNSKFTSPTSNVLLRLQNSFASALNKKVKKQLQPLPRYFLVILDDDLISYLGYEGPGATEILGSWIKWLAEKFQKLIKDRYKQIPDKCKKQVCTYWSIAPMHNNFDENLNEMRRKFNFCLETTIKTFDQMRVIKLKAWDQSDIRLVFNNSFSERGIRQYWDCIDVAIQFNVERHDLFLARKLIAENAKKMEELKNKTSGGNETSKEEKNKQKTFENRYHRGNSPAYDRIPQFFHCHTDRFHWQSSKSSQHRRLQSGNRFMLPRPRR